MNDHCPWRWMLARRPCCHPSQLSGVFGDCLVINRQENELHVAHLQSASESDHGRLWGLQGPLGLLPIEQMGRGARETRHIVQSSGQFGGPQETTSGADTGLSGFGACSSILQVYPWLKLVQDVIRGGQHVLDNCVCVCVNN